MKARITDIKRFAVHDGDGIRTTVFLKGCPLKCVWCHNPEGLSGAYQLAYHADKCVDCGQCATVCPSNAQRIAGGKHYFDRDFCTLCSRCVEPCPAKALHFYGQNISAERLLKLLLEDRDFYETSGGGVTLSGGECLMQADFCQELLIQLKEHGIHTAVDTCGFVPWRSLEAVIPYTDLFLYDIKAYDKDTHIRCTGQSNGLILDNLRRLDAYGAKIEIRIPYVPGWNDDQMEKIAQMLSQLKHISKVKVLPYHKFASSKYASLGMKNTLPEQIPTEEEIEITQKLFDSVINNEV